MPTLAPTIPQHELAYQDAQCFEGQIYKAFCALDLNNLTTESDVATWENSECSGGGYAAAFANS